MKTGFKSLCRKYLSGFDDVYLLLYIPVFFAVFFFQNREIIPEATIIEVPIDRYIPFCEWMIFPYGLWYVYAFGTPLFMLWKDGKEFKRYMYMMIIIYSISLLIYILWPTGQNLRPDVLPDNVAGVLVGMIYSADPPVNVMPSLHVSGSLIAMWSVVKSEYINKIWVKILFFAGGLSIIAGAVLVKQHSVLDVVGGVVLFLLVLPIVYHKRKVLNEE